MAGAARAGLLLVLCLGAAGARAQTPLPLAEWQFSAGTPLQPLFEPEIPEWQIRLGASVGTRPLYDGARPYRLAGGPMIDIRYRDLFFASVGEGIGVNLLRGGNWRAGMALTYDLGRHVGSYQTHLRGLGNINPAVEAKLFADYVISKEFPLVLRADLRRSLGGSDGWIGDIGAYMPMPGSSARLFWFAGPSLTFADARYMGKWFGIGQAQAARSGYRRFDARAGLRSVSVGVSAVWFFREHWFAAADASFERLLGGAADSPITERKGNGALFLTIGYRF
jgi:outer membrane scaffolding protein for murein synthesis (MipA/OmpV family)